MDLHALSRSSDYQVVDTPASNDRLRIAFYSPALPGSGVSNGIVTYTGIMRDELRKLGHSVIIVTPDQIDCDGVVAAVPRPNRIVRAVRAFMESRRQDDGSTPWGRLRVFEAFYAARRAGAQIFEIEESFGWAGRLAGRGIPIIERLHGPHVFVRGDRESAEQKALGDFREAAERASFEKVAAVTSPTQRLLDALFDLYGHAATYCSRYSQSHAALTS